MLAWVVVVFQLSLANALMQYTTCYADAMGVPYAVEVQFGDLKDNIVAWADVDVPYLRAMVVYDLEEMASFPDSLVRRVVVHELAHFLTWELVELAEEVDKERAWRLDNQLVTRIERWPVWLAMCQ